MKRLPACLPACLPAYLPAFLSACLGPALLTACLLAWFENSFYRAQGGKWDKVSCAGCPQQRYATGKPGKVQGLDRVGIVEGPCRYRARGVSIRGKFVFRETWGTRLGVYQGAKRSSDPRVAYPEVNVQVRDLVRVVDIVSPCPTGDGYPGKIHFIEPKGGMVHWDMCLVPQTAVRQERARQSSGTAPCGDCRKVLWVPGARSQISGKLRFIEKPGVQYKGGRQGAKHNSDLRVAYPEVKVQVRELIESAVVVPHIVQQ